MNERKVRNPKDKRIEPTFTVLTPLSVEHKRPADLLCASSRKDKCVCHFLNFHEHSVVKSLLVVCVPSY